MVNPVREIIGLEGVRIWLSSTLHLRLLQPFICSPVYTDGAELVDQLLVRLSSLPALTYRPE